jgi:ketosteroid isomerase-like protein
VPLDPAIEAKLEALMPQGDWIEAAADEESSAARLAALRELAAPDLEIAMVGPGGFTGSFHGVEGFSNAWEDWLVPFESYSVEPMSLEAVGDCVLFTGKQTAVAKGSEHAMENTASAVFFFRGDQLARIEFHLDPAAARRAAGLDP